MLHVISSRTVWNRGGDTMCYSSTRWSEDYAECKSCRLRTDWRGGQARKALPPMQPETLQDLDLEHYRLSA